MIRIQLLREKFVLTFSFLLRDEHGQRLRLQVRQRPPHDADTDQDCLRIHQASFFSSFLAPDVDEPGYTGAIAAAKRKTCFSLPGLPRTQNPHCLRRQVRRGRK